MKPLNKKAVEEIEKRLLGEAFRRGRNRKERELIAEDLLGRLDRAPKGQPSPGRQSSGASRGSTGGQGMPMSREGKRDEAKLLRDIRAGRLGRRGSGRTGGGEAERVGSWRAGRAARRGCAAEPLNKRDRAGRARAIRSPEVGAWS